MPELCNVDITTRNVLIEEPDLKKLMDWIDLAPKGYNIFLNEKIARLREE